MTVVYDDIAKMSPYTVDDSGNFTEAIFDYLSAVAKLQLDKEDPGLSSSMFDYAWALLICHLYTIKRGSAGFKSEKIGDYSYAQDPGMTSYLMEYQDILKTFKTTETYDEADVTRADADMGELKLDQNDMPTYYED